MNSEQLAHYRSLLEKQLSSLTETAQLHQQQMDESHTTKDFVGGDRAAELESMEVDTSISESELNLVKKIEHALKRVESGEYGKCEGCGGEIGSARLDAKPSVSLCINCQEAHEAE